MMISEIFHFSHKRGIDPTKPYESKYKTRKSYATTSTASSQGGDVFEYKAKTYHKQKKECNKKNKIGIVLKNLR